MAEKQNTPEIRFEGFTDPWEQRKLGELCAISKGHGYSKADIRDAGTPLILYGRLYTQYESRIENVDTFAVEQEGSLLSKGNEVIVPASGETAEDIAVASSVRRSGIIFGGDLNVVTPVSKLDPDYIALAITYSKAHDDLAKRAQGKSVVHVHGNDIAEVEIPYPSESEQKRISTVVLGLDNLITLHQRKYDKLCTVKKSMLDKMFPKPGETEPEIRFEGFTDPWEQRKLGDIAPVTMGQSPNGACYTDNPNDAVLVQGNADLKDGWVFPRVWTTEITKTAKAGDLIMSVRAPVGAMGKTAYDVVLGRGVAGIAGNEFLFQALSKKEAEGYWSTVSAGSTFDSINGDELRNTPVDYPRSKPEREAVGSCLSRIDCLITLHQRKLELLRNIKKSLLDRMFV